MGVFKKSKEVAKPNAAAEPITNNRYAEQRAARAERKIARAERREQRAAAAPMGVQDEQKKVLRGNIPKANTTNTAEHEVKKFEKMTYKERLNLFNSNPQQYHKLAESLKGAKK